jgi:hypothetical protein
MDLKKYWKKEVTETMKSIPVCSAELTLRSLVDFVEDSCVGLCGESEDGFGDTGGEEVDGGVGELGRGVGPLVGEIVLLCCL